MGVAVTDLRVVCKSITCVLAYTEAFTKMAIIFLEIYSKSCCRSGHSALQATRRMPLWALAIALATGKNTKLLGVLDQNVERERIFHLRVTACREQGSHCRHERLAWVASRYGGRGLHAPAHSSRKSWKRTTIELTTFILWLIHVH